MILLMKEDILLNWTRKLKKNQMINKNFGGLFQRKSEKLFLNIIDNFI